MTTDPQFWNKLADKYAAQAVGNPEAFERKIDVTKALLTSESVVLNIGCGTGSLALRLAPDAGHVHGLDFSDAMIGIARGKLEAADFDNVTFHVGAVESVATLFEPGSLDVVCAYSILHLLEDPPAAVSQIFDLLKPGGAFVSSTVVLGQTWVPYRPILAVMRWIGKAPLVQILSPDQLAELFEAAGFVDVVAPDVGAESTVAFLTARKPA
jgi:arsenite methyltransferase